MKRLVDIVNFNCDASCLASSRWLAALDGGTDSELCRWTSLYVRHGKRVVLGFTGSTLADIQAFNPEALAVVNGHPEIFSAVVRPFAHDIHLLRHPASFRYNVALGRLAQRSVLPKLRDGNCYLPPEFMLTSEQVSILDDIGLTIVFINANRFVADYRTRIPTFPYRLRGLFGTTVGCRPINGHLTDEYLHAMQGYDAETWNAALLAEGPETLLLWRDGESCFLVPDGLAREEHWLSGETSAVTRCGLEDLDTEFTDCEDSGDDLITHYPIHSFAQWMKEFRMLGYLGRLARYEDECVNGSSLERALWLSLIGSDVLSAVEKRAVRVRLSRANGSTESDEHTLHRTLRDFEAQEYLVLLEQLRSGANVSALVETASEPHLRKLWARDRFIAAIERDVASKADARV
jgi:hypothetical protein